MNIMKVIAVFAFIISVVMLVKPVKRKYKDGGDIQLIKAYWIIASILFIGSLIVMTTT